MSTELQTTNETVSMLSVIDRAARDPSVDVGKMERLLALSEQIHAREAKALYDQAISAAQAEMRPISRDCSNPQTRSKYASYEAIDMAIRPIYTQHGFGMSYGSKASPHPDHVIVTCRVSHRGGHTEYVELDMPADGKGAKGNDVMTRTHATGSALSYAKRYIANLVWNLSFGEADDDGNGAGGRPPSTPRPAYKSPAPARPEPKQATPADVLPKAATEATRKWALEKLTAQFSPEEVWNFLVARCWITADRTLEAWPLEHVPTTNQALGELAKEIQATLPPVDAPSASELPEEIASQIITVPRSGMKRADYLQNPDTIGSLYAAASTDESSRKRLFGMANDWQPQPWTRPADGKVFPVSEDDKKCRAALDLFLEWETTK